MYLAVRFRIMHHVTLGLACACLIVASRFHLPLLPWFLVPCLGLLALAFVAQGRWGLPMWAANLLAVVIAGTAVGWVNWQVHQDESWLAQVPLPAGLVPYLGPLLLALLLAKLFRRGPGSPPDMEFWELQGIGLTLVALACVLATGPLFGILFAAYLACALSCLSLHHLFVRARTEGPVACPEGRHRVPWFLFRWLVLVGGAGLVLFLVTPRLDSRGWDPFEQFGDQRHAAFGSRFRAVLGYIDEVDLNRAGQPDISEEVAFRVEAKVRGFPYADLPPDQRWRGTVLETYRQGVWPAMRIRFPALTPQEKSGRDLDRLEAEGSLAYRVWPEMAGGLFLAEPVAAGPRETPMPVRALDDHGDWTLLPFRRYSGTLVPKLFSAEGQLVYRQVFSPEAVRNRVPAPTPLPPDMDRLTACPVPGLAEWTGALVRRLAEHPGSGLDLATLVNARARTPDSGEEGGGPPGLPGDLWEPVAVALSEYLAHSGEYRYDLSHDRVDPNLDPVLDYLVHVKAGRCERHASALALMLRSLGVPARLVSGFQGREHVGDGQYVVRHRHAHVWVEALVARRGRPGTFDWLMLDPTPGLEVGPQGGLRLVHWWQQQTEGPLSWWRELIVRYDASRQASLWRELFSEEGGVSTRAWLFLLPTLAAGLVGGWVGRRFWRVTWARRRSGRRGKPSVPFYARLLDIAERHLGVRPDVGRTARELAGQMREALALRGAGALSAIPGEVAASFYRVRFGGEALSEGLAGKLAQALDRLETWLREHPADLAEPFAETVPSILGATRPIATPRAKEPPR